MTPEGYPDDQEIETIAQWNGGWHELMNYVRDRWEFCNWGWVQENLDSIVMYRLSTGGWSGNESLIAAMRDNWMFWSLCWRSSNRGGAHTFEIAN